MAIKPESESAPGQAARLSLEAPGRLLDKAYFLALRVTGNPPWAEDAVQEAWVWLATHPPSRADEPATEVYFLRTVRGRALDLLRSENARRKREAAVGAGEGREAAMTTTSRPERQAELRELGAAARAALAHLPDELRQAVSLCCELDCSQEAAAEILGVPPRTVSHRVNEGLERLRRELEVSGFAGAAAAGLARSLGALELPSAPAGLIAKLKALPVAEQGMALSAATAAKGGIAMKVVVGVVLAGALAGGAALFLGPATDNRQPATNLASPPAAVKPPVELAPIGGPLRQEHYTGCNLFCGAPSFGPRLEASQYGGTFDEHWNLWGVTSVLRASDGRIIPIGEIDSFNQAAEGPASAIPNLAGNFGYGQNFTSFAVVGLPLEGGDKGALYYSTADQMVRIWKNPEKEGRWWYRRVMGNGKTPPPGARGQSAPAEGLRLSILGLQATKEGQLIIFSDGSFYRYDGKSITCLLTLGDYQAKGPQKSGQGGGPGVPQPTQGVMDADGKTFYVGYYYAPNHLPEIWRVSEDGAKVEPYVRQAGGGAADGPGWSAAFFCGPHMGNGLNDPRFLPPGVLLISTHDESGGRRVKDGRVAHLCRDGQWREMQKFIGDGGSGAPGGVPGWFRGGIGPHGPGGTVLQTGSPCSGGPDYRTWIVSGFDFAKPSAAQLGGGKP